MKWLRNIPIKIFGLFCLPVFMYIVWSFVSYPLQPHCSLGNGLLGCTPYCEPTTYMENGKPASYKSIPCFHNEPSNFQSITYRYSLIYYFVILLLTTIIAIKVGIKIFYIKLFRIIFAPFILIRESKNEGVIARVLIILSTFFLVLEWGYGYFVVIQTFTGIKLLD